MSTDTPRPERDSTAATAGPPVAKYRYTLTITGNSHAEIVRELGCKLRGGYLLDSDYETRDEFTVYGGRGTSRLEHLNPDMTTERYDAELDAWWRGRRKESRDD